MTPSMLDNISYGTFIFFGAFSLAGGLFVWWFVPETKGAWNLYPSIDIKTKY